MARRMRGGKKENREMSHKWVPPANKDPELTNTHEFLDLLLLPLVQVAPLSAAEIQNHRAREDELHREQKKGRWWLRSRLQTTREWFPGISSLQSIPHRVLPLPLAVQI